ncbi:MAG: hypothetical protein QXM16_05870 [Nitrososphaerota archaeon]
MVCEERGLMRLKLPRTAWQSLNIPDKGEYIGVIRGRYDITAGWRSRIPSMYKSLFYLEANEGREVRIFLWVEDGIPCFSYEEGDCQLKVYGWAFPLVVGE